MDGWMELRNKNKWTKKGERKKDRKKERKKKKEERKKERKKERKRKQIECFFSHNSTLSEWCICLKGSWLSMTSSKPAASAARIFTHTHTHTHTHHTHTHTHTHTTTHTTHTHTHTHTQTHSWTAVWKILSVFLPSTNSLQKITPHISDVFPVPSPLASIKPCVCSCLWVYSHSELSWHTPLCALHVSKSSSTRHIPHLTISTRVFLLSGRHQQKIMAGL